MLCTGSLYRPKPYTNEQTGIYIKSQNIVVFLSLIMTSKFTNEAMLIKRRQLIRAFYQSISAN
jgi:hypothetical protein